MSFDSLHFLAFFLVVLAVNHLLRARVQARNAFLLAASYYFYGCWDWRFLSLIVLSTGVDFVCARRMRLSNTYRRKTPDSPRVVRARPA